MIDQQPLVSVVVVTYNSSKYVLETLESIKRQTYLDIELIITDDCSVDDSVDICGEWLEKNRGRFVRTVLLTSPMNTGIPGNVNRGFKIAEGEWIKGIAGDDMLMADAIENYITAVTDSVKCFVGEMQCFCVGDNGQIAYKEIWPVKNNLSFFTFSSAKQHKKLLTRSFNFAPGVFMRKSVYEDCGDFDERFRYIEDLPYWLLVTSKGIKFDFLPKVTVLYRTQHESAVFSSGNYFNTGFYDCLYRFRKTVIYPQVPWWNIVYYQSEMIEHLQYKLIRKLFKNKKTRKAVVCCKLLGCLRVKRYVDMMKAFFNR